MEPASASYPLSTYLEKIPAGSYTLRLSAPRAFAPIILHKSGLFPRSVYVAFLSYQDQPRTNLFKKYLKKQGWTLAASKAREIIAEFFKINQNHLISNREEEITFHNPLRNIPIYLKYKESFAEQDPTLADKIQAGGEWYLGEQKIFFRTKLLNQNYREEPLKLIGIKINDKSLLLKKGYLFSSGEHHNHTLYTLADASQRVISMISVISLTSSSIFLFNGYTILPERGKGFMKDLVSYVLLHFSHKGYTHAFTIVPLNVVVHRTEVVWPFYKYSKPRSSLQSTTEAK